MIYQLGQVSNRDTQVLYFYRILRHTGTDLSTIYRYNNPDVYQLSQAVETTIEGKTWFEYHLSANEKVNRIPYLEFSCTNEVELKHIEDLIEVEVREDELVLRGDTDELTERTSVAVYWVPSLAYIDKLQKQIEAIIGDLRKRVKEDANLIDKISVSSDYVMNLEGVVPNLVNISKDEEGLIYDDSHYMLSGSLDAQTLVNPPQELVSKLLKSHKGMLIISDMLKENKVYQGFYGGCIRLSGNFRILVLKDITSILFLDQITAERVIIENCPAVIFRKSLKEEGSSEKIIRLELRNSYLTVNQSIEIRNIWCYRRSTAVLRRGKIHTIGFIEAGSSLIFDTPGNNNILERINATTLQGLFYVNDPSETMPYLDEIFMAQKPIAFQRGTVEDPLPISEAEVSVYLKHSSSGPSPGHDPSSSGKIYSPFLDWYWSGDSRTVGLIDATGTSGQGFVGEGLDKLIQEKNNIVSGSQNHNLALWWGVNDLRSGYPAVYQEIADSLGNLGMVFVCTIGRVFDTNSGGTIGDEGGWGTTTVAAFNEQIKAWNEQLKSDLAYSANIRVLDVWQFIEDCAADHDVMELAASKGNGLHYSGSLSKMIYDWVCQQITNDEGGSVSPVPEDSDVAAVWNWFTNAGIAGVSDKPEVIAGILGNFMVESPNYGDYYNLMVLGHNSTYYGMWCESNSDFRDYMHNQGFSFYEYYHEPSSSRDREAISHELAWLTMFSSSWRQNFIGNLSTPTSQTGEAGARAYAELFAAGVEICIGVDDTSDFVRDPGVANCSIGGTYTPASKGQYQSLALRRDRAAEVYNKYAGG